MLKQQKNLEIWKLLFFFHAINQETRPRKPFLPVSDLVDGGVRWRLTRSRVLFILF